MRRATAFVVGALLVLGACGTATGQQGTTLATKAPSATAVSAPQAAVAGGTGATAMPSMDNTSSSSSGNGSTTGSTDTAAPAAATNAPAPTATQAPAKAAAPTATPAPTPAPVTGGTTIAVTLREMAIVLSKPSAPSGTVTFAVTNSGTVVHEFVVLKTTIAQDQIPADPTRPGTVQEPGLVGRLANVAPGGSGNLTLTLGAGAYVFICNEPAHYLAGMHAAFTVTGGMGLLPRNAPAAMASVASATVAASPNNGTIINATLQEMSIALDRTSAPAGIVTFLVTNAGTVQHELVVEQTDIAEDKLPAGDEPGKASEQWWVGETGDIDASHFSGVQLLLTPGKYVLLCNEPGHYAAGMHLAFTVTAAGAGAPAGGGTGKAQSTVQATLQEMSISLDKTSAPAGVVTFLVTNVGTVQHELVVEQTDIAQDKLPAGDEPGKVSEQWWVGETGDIDAGHFSAVSLDLPSGNYVLICNEPGHYAAGMHVAFIVK